MCHVMCRVWSDLDLIVAFLLNNEVMQTSGGVQLFHLFCYFSLKNGFSLLQIKKSYSFVLKCDTVILQSVSKVMQRGINH